jgi:bifunctional UDP-N-acetylglucosamine pyrophosphorylase/glucosamine-1-phosphate N-acetyltransferase
MEAVVREARSLIPEAAAAVQADRLGTAHAVSMARPALEGFTGTILILYGDVPLVMPGTLKTLVEQVSPRKPLAVLGFEARNPTGYGRLKTGTGGEVLAIREDLDATAEERAITLCNSGIIAVDSQLLSELLPQIGNANRKGEFYLTDLVELAGRSGQFCGLSVCSESEVAGVNDRVQLAEIEQTFQRRYRQQHLLGGATLVAPDTVFFSADTVIGQDVIIEPHVVFGPGVTVDDGVEILGFSPRRPLCAAPPGRRDRRERPCGQLRRGQEGLHRQGCKGQSPELYRRRPRRRRQ